LEASLAALGDFARRSEFPALCYGCSMQSAVGILAVLGLLVACEPKPTQAPPEPEIVKAPAGAVQDIVRDALLDAKKDQRRVVVYVGASWCEPCQVFLDGVAAGNLPPSLGNLRLLKFDNDVDDARLKAANFGGQMIPRFVKPAADGTGSTRRFEGSVKGPAAMDNIVPRLEALLGEP